MDAHLRRHAIGYAFILPWLVALALFIGYPFVAGFCFSFCDYPPLKSPVFIGVDNYVELASDAKFQRSLGVTLIYAAVAIPLGVALALVLAMFLNARIRGQSFYRVIYYVPHLVPTVAVAILWLWIFNPKFGLLNIVLAGLVDAADRWAGLFFGLGSESGQGFLRPEAAALLAAPVLAAVAIGPLVPPAIRARPGLNRFLASAAVLALILAGLALVNAALHWGLPVDMRKLHSPGWLSDGNPLPADIPFAPSWALWALIVMSMWGVGQMAVIYLAKLQDVPVELYEAADIDGANWAQKTWQITIPMISPVILFNVVMAIIGTFQVFTEPYIMTGGGPEDKTRFVAMFIYDQTFQYHRVGYASAVAWVLFLLIVGLTMLAFRLSQKRVYYEGR
jgi:ABC-type sugar transport system permease subunit